MTKKFDYDVLVVGAGLASGMAAWFLRQNQPSLKIKILERYSQPLTEKTWSFHVTDLGDLYDVVHPLVSRSWADQNIYFAGFQRTVQLAYASIRPEEFYQKVEAVLNEPIQFSTDVLSVRAHEVTLKGGGIVTARCVLDARGFAERPPSGGYQKFIGWHVRLKQPHKLARPIIMDAERPQNEGFRFMYLLPWSRNELLIEDTFYTNGPELNEAAIEMDIRTYLQLRGWEVDQILQKEKSALPIPFGPSPKEQFNNANTAVAIGVRGEFFHPVTGYSLPEAVRVASILSKLQDLTTETARVALQELRDDQAWQKKFFYFLNRMMFRAGRPENRYRIFKRFYGLSESLIAAFYAGRLTFAHQLRILAGKPPVPVSGALRCLVDAKP